MTDAYVAALVRYSQPKTRLATADEIAPAADEATAARRSWQLSPLVERSPYPSDSLVQLASVFRRSGDPRAEIVSGHVDGVDGFPSKARAFAGNTRLSRHLHFAKGKLPDGSALRVEVHGHHEKPGAKAVTFTWTPAGDHEHYFHTVSINKARDLADRFADAHAETGEWIQDVIAEGDRRGWKSGYGRNRVKYSNEGRISFRGNGLTLSDVHDNFKNRHRDLISLGKSLRDLTNFTTPDDELHLLAKEALTTGNGTAASAAIDGLLEAGHKGKESTYLNHLLQARLLTLGASGHEIQKTTQKILEAIPLTQDHPEHEERYVDILRHYLEGGTSVGKNGRVYLRNPKPKKYRRKRKGGAYQAPAGGTVVRGIFYPGGSLIPDLEKFAAGDDTRQSKPKRKTKQRSKSLRKRLKRFKSLVVDYRDYGLPTSDAEAVVGGGEA